MSDTTSYTTTFPDEGEESAAVIAELEAKIEGLLNGNKQTEAHITELTNLLRDCCRTFRDYQIYHLAKNDLASAAKAERNRLMADKIEALLHKPRNVQPVEIVKVTTFDQTAS